MEDSPLTRPSEAAVSAKVSTSPTSSSATTPTHRSTFSAGSEGGDSLAHSLDYSPPVVATIVRVSSDTNFDASKPQQQKQELLPEVTKQPALDTIDTKVFNRPLAPRFLSSDQKQQGSTGSTMSATTKNTPPAHAAAPPVPAAASDSAAAAPKPGRSRRSRRANSDEIPRMVQGHMTGTEDVASAQAYAIHQYQQQLQQLQQQQPGLYYGHNPYAAAPYAGSPRVSRASRTVGSSAPPMLPNPLVRTGSYDGGAGSFHDAASGTTSHGLPPPPRHTRTGSFDGGAGGSYDVGRGMISHGLPRAQQQHYPARTSFQSQQQQRHPVHASSMTTPYLSIPPNGESTTFGSETQRLLERNPVERGNLKHQPSPAPRRRSSRKHHSSHRRSLSSSAAVTDAYGSFWQAPTAGGLRSSRSAVVQPSSYDEAVQNLRREAARNVQFSPRGEFMSLTQSLRTTGGQPGSPASVGSSSRKIYHANNTWSPRSVNSGAIPAAPMLVGSGEALFLVGSTDAGDADGPGGARISFRHRSESVRKMHMRQQSAQLWMEDIKGTEQSPACRDIFFLLLFVFHLLFIGYLGSVYGKEALESHFNDYKNDVANSNAMNTTATSTVMDSMSSSSSQDEEVTVYYSSFIYVGCLAGPFAVIVSSLLLGLMTTFARHFVQVALMIVIALSFIWGTVGIGLSPKSFVPVTGIIALALTVAYAFIVWERIPFASANLLCALSAIKAFSGTIVVAFCFQALALVWLLYYVVVVCGVYDSIKNGSLPVPHEFHALVYTFMGISFYWTFQVLQNSVQVITAAVVGGWWYNPDDRTIVRRSCFKTFFYRMGSICFGSLVVGPVRLLRQLSGLVRPTSVDSASLMCVHECLHCIQTCISSCVDTIAFNFNPWGFTYVGLYGYGFLDASRHASELFERRGWTVIVSDDLVPNILLIASLVIGGVTGCLAHLLSYLDRLHLTSLNQPGLTSFFEGVLIGLVLTSVLFGMISSSVNAVIVCFAVSPVDFEDIHPELSHEMRTCWMEVWPGALDVLDVRMAVSPRISYQDIGE